MLGKAGPCIFVLHRFEAEDMNTGRIRASQVAPLLEWIRRRRYRILDVADLIAELREGRSPAAPAIAFTIDDGYADQADIGIPLFLRYDCPITTFLCTGFLDQTHWMWYDQIEFLLRTAEPQRVELDVPGGVLKLDLRDSASRDAASRVLIARCKSELSIDGRTVAAALAERLKLPLPSAVPPEYGPMSWDDARRLEAQGARFGAHSVSHLVLSHASPEIAAREIRESRERIHRELTDPSPVFCFPFGKTDDYRPDDMHACRASGFDAAVTALAGYPPFSRYTGDSLAVFEVPRFAFEVAPYRNMQIIKEALHR